MEACAVMAGRAAKRLLDSYDAERRAAARRNLEATNATMRFLAPHGLAQRMWRGLVLRMAPRSRWFRARVNSGRLAEPASYANLGIAPGPPDPGPSQPRDRRSRRPLPEGGRVRDRLGQGFVVILPRPLTDMPDWAEPMVVGPASVYGPDRAWLVRPDGYIAGSEPMDRSDDLMPRA